MKTKLLFALLMASAIGASAQITNQGFENWTTTGTYEEPDGWASMNPYISGSSFLSCTMSTDHYPANVGSYSARLENNTALTQFTGGYGMLASGGFYYPFEPVFPVTGHPTSLTGYFKYDPLNFDTMFVAIILFDNGNTVVSRDFQSGATTANWTAFNIDFPTYATADSGFILISAFRPTDQTDGPNGNSVLYIDNLNFDVLLTGVREISETDKFSIYPNPFVLSTTLQTDRILKNASLTVYNAVGQAVKRLDNLVGQTIVLQRDDLPSGLYFSCLTEYGKVISSDKLVVTD